MRNFSVCLKALLVRRLFYFTVFAVFLAAAFSSLTSCDNRERLYLYNWTYYTPPSVIEKFEEEFGVRVIYDEFPSNEEMFAKIQAGGSGYDVVFPSAHFVTIMNESNMLERLDKSKLSNLGNIDPVMIEKMASYDPGMQFSVPYYWGAAGIIVNTARVPQFERSWSILSRTDLAGRMTMLDDMREVFGSALVTLGFSVNTHSPVEIELARNHINNVWRPNLLRFDAEAFGLGYATEDFWVVHGYVEQVFADIADNPRLMANTVFFIPPEGGPSYVDSMVILNDAPNKELAYKFIDFIHRPDIYAEFVDTFGLPSTVNVPARRLQRVRPIYEAEDIYHTEMVIDVGAALEFYQNAWFNSIRIGN